MRPPAVKKSAYTYSTFPSPTEGTPEENAAVVVQNLQVAAVPAVSEHNNGLVCGSKNKAVMNSWDLYTVRALI